MKDKNWIWFFIIGLIILAPTSIYYKIQYNKMIINDVLDEREQSKPPLWKDEISGIIIQDTTCAPQSIVFFKHKWVKYPPTK